MLKTHSWSTIKLDRNGLQQYWEHALKRKWDWVQITKPPQICNLPDILTQKEVAKILVATQKRRYAVFLYTVYSLPLAFLAIFIYAMPLTISSALASTNQEGDPAGIQYYHSNLVGNNTQSV